MVNSLIASLGDGNTHSLSDISREYNSLTGHKLDPKPFHNQLKKPELEQLTKQILQMALTKWVRTTYQFNSNYKKFFNRILLHDGSTLTLHNGLKDIFPGRYTKTSPAAVELHVSMDLMTNSVVNIDVAPDTQGERQFLPEAEELTQSLLLADAGYFDKAYFDKLCHSGAYFVMRAGKHINPQVLSGVNCSGKALKTIKTRKLKEIQNKLPKNQSFELSIRWENQLYRLIGFWVADQKCFSYLITNLPKSDFGLQDVGSLYRLRWQIELLFKELKSHNNLKKFNTKNANIIKTLIWSSLLALTLKRLLSGFVEEKYSILLSTLTVSKTIQGWWHHLFEAIINKSQRRILTALNKCSDILRSCAKLSHPKRDKKSGKFQFLIESANCNIL